ncbi:hypothetical protein [Candidatus Poriferisodalis sp.]|uniref:hypothetical protein n=1 Tax=Candidatus Poriferisodalis sp. TaxID=3101277 RepID=UPI003B02CFFD
MLLPFFAPPAVEDLVEVTRSIARERLGSNLARMELRAALEEWLARFPNFELATDADGRGAEWGGSQIRGPRNLLIRVGI